jgi:hypothetical protein
MLPEPINTLASNIITFADSRPDSYLLNVHMEDDGSH